MITKLLRCTRKTHQTLVNLTTCYGVKRATTGRQKPSTAAGLPVLINRHRCPPPSISQLEAFPTSFPSAHRRSPLATQRKRSMGTAALDQKLAMAKRCSHGIIYAPPLLYYSIYHSSALGFYLIFRGTIARGSHGGSKGGRRRKRCSCHPDGKRTLQCNLTCSNARVPS